jgi:hypothetical protein
VDFVGLGLASGARLCQLYGELAFLGYEEGVGCTLVLKLHFCARKVGLHVLELALEGKNLFLKPVIERLELLYSGAIDVCGTQDGSVVALTGLRRGRESHGVVCCCGKFVGSVTAFFFVGKVVVFDVGVEANRR